MKILVTGVAGAIGSHLAERLADLGHKVVGIDALTGYYSKEIKKLNAKEVESKGIKIHYIDLVRDHLDEIISNQDVIFHLAAQPGISASTPFEHYLDNNVIATYKLLESAKKNNDLKILFYISTSSVYGKYADGDEMSEPKPTSIYGATKLASEQLALSYHRDIGLPVSVFRLFSVYGERERPDKFWHKLIKSIHEDKEIHLFEGSENHIRSYTYVEDIIDGLILALDNLDKVNGEIFNLGTNKTNTTKEGIKIIEQIMGKKAKIKVIPKRQGDQLETACNIKKIKNLLGYRPKVNLDKGLEAQVKWYGSKIYRKI